MENLINIQYYIDDGLQNLSTISFISTNTIKTLKEIISISTQIKSKDFYVYFNNRKLDDYSRVIDVMKNQFNVPRFHIRSKRKTLILIVFFSIIFYK